MNDGSFTTSVVNWTGHRMQDERDRSNSSFEEHSVVITPYTLEEKEAFEIVMGKEYTHIEYMELDYRFALMHELSHQLGAQDHYCYENGGDGACSNDYCDECKNGQEDPRACLMSYVYDISDLTDENMYCDDCLTIIQEYLNEYL